MKDTRKAERILFLTCKINKIRAMCYEKMPRIYHNDTKIDMCKSVISRLTEQLDEAKKWRY